MRRRVQSGTPCAVACVRKHREKNLYFNLYPAIERCTRVFLEFTQLTVAIIIYVKGSSVLVRSYSRIGIFGSIEHKMYYPLTESGLHFGQCGARSVTAAQIGSRKHCNRRSAGIIEATSCRSTPCPLVSCACCRSSRNRSRQRSQRHCPDDCDS